MWKMSIVSMIYKSKNLERNQILNNKQIVELEHKGQWNNMQLLKMIITKHRYKHENVYDFCTYTYWKYKIASVITSMRENVTIDNVGRWFGWIKIISLSSKVVKCFYF